MERLELSDELLHNIRAYMIAKKYPYNTLRTYGHNLNRIFEKHKYLDKEVVRTLLKKFKHQNQRAVLVLINRYCYDESIDFRIILPRTSRKKRQIIQIFSQEEVDIIINSVPKPYDLSLKCIFKIGAGLRVSEMIKLSWAHFRWALWNQDRSKDGAVEIRDSKGGSRICRVPRNLMEEVYEYAKKQRVLNEFGLPQGGVIFKFGGEYKKELMANNLDLWKDKYIKHAYDWFRYNILKKYCEKALGRKIKVHQLRHTRATELVEKDVPITTIQNQLGHKEIGTTMIYIHASNKKIFGDLEGID